MTPGVCVYQKLGLYVEPAWPLAKRSENKRKKAQNTFFPFFHNPYYIWHIFLFHNLYGEFCRIVYFILKILFYFFYLNSYITNHDCVIWPTAIYNYNDNGDHFVQLDIGDTVHILEETDSELLTLHTTHTCCSVFDIPLWNRYADNVFIVAGWTWTMT